MSPANTKTAIARRFLLSPRIEIRSVLLDAGVEFTDTRIAQDYLYAGPQQEARVRRIRNDGRTTYIHTVKSLTQNAKVKAERKVTEAEYFTLMQKRLPELRQINKARILFVYMGQSVGVDVFESHPGLILLGIEQRSRNPAIALPRFISPLREVTTDYRFTHSHLARVSHSSVAELVPGI